MKIQLDWLKTYIDHGLSAQELSHLLTMGGLEIEASEQVELGKGRTTEVLELNVTPNRGYCLSHIGVAREVGAMIQKACKIPDPDKKLKKAMGSVPVKTQIAVANDEADLCPRYTAMVIENVTPGPSPAWLADRMKAVGLRPINNIVDITNFVMLEYGQPLHAFDLALLEGQEIVIRRARRKEPFTALDGTELKLEPDALVIADAKKPVALAGIMGGTNSQVDLSTRTVVLESAYFDPVSVRKTSKKYGLRSDSSYRFERGVDIEGVAKASSRAALLIQELAGGEICKGRIDIYFRSRKSRRFDVRVSRTNQVLGTRLSAKKIVKYLKSLGIEIVKEKKEGETYQVQVPTSRPDLTREIDLIEEVARLDGYDRIEVSHPEVLVSPVRMTPLQNAVNRSKEVLRNQGYSEAVNYSFIETDMAGYFQNGFDREFRDLIQLDNPISEDMNTMRPSLIPGLIKSAARNLNRGQKSLQLFEQGHIFYSKKGKKTKEYPSLAALATGPYPHSVWKDNQKSFDFYDLKGALESLATAFKVDLEYKPCSREELLDRDQSVDVYAGKKCMGYLGRLMPILSERWDLNPETCVFELNLERLIAAMPQRSRFKPIPRFPETFRDISLLVDQTVPVQTVCDLIEETGKPLIHKVELFDLYQGKNLQAGKKSLAFALSFQSAEKTLTDAEVNPVFDRIVESLADRLGAALRE
ncbi:MAG: phenylalanine--tRNA ligase subunit beta [Nitrospinaceae bacterium]|nr:phenylalanine--tRNA ligase subunit beta [Nitrospinaceae bacterium]NIR55779.1 phenylalanine--tRNA ligase subunit beta [Nitrospinaceae bacterium]NIS86231.1 phenylalanine--tRNA ligase subunit beta [Nitrospinaceae bacterium]NIT83062.1 phenylalanine--tRNA ligase subunit beta [Nitrospinaceae bacterium]NIU45272.1 phenylalanine--tRNA ligase subunit beta [Nitrospinaceae bacterium]